MSRKLRVLFVTSGYYPALGGGELYNQKLADLATGLGYQVRVLTIADRADEAHFESGADVRYVPGEPFANQRRIPTAILSEELKRFAPDIVQCNGPNVQDVDVRRLADRQKIPFVALYYADFRQDRLSSRIATWLYNRLVLKKSAAVLTISRAYEDILKARGVPHAIVSNLGMGVDTQTFRPAHSGRRQEDRLLFVGRLDANHSYKRVDLLLDAVADMRKRGSTVTLHVVGDGDTRDAAEAHARELGLDRAVRFLGDVTLEELRSEYQQAAILVLPSPSISEGFGMVVVEALSSGASVVTSEQAGANEIVRDSGIGTLWDGRNVASLVGAIEDELERRNREGDVADRAHAFAEREYAWNAVARRLDDCYRALARRQR
jgi:glycosyltransferase involved in cell wall biosynthesis